MAEVHTQTQKAIPATPTQTHGVMLQRKCSCGGTPGPTGECENCRKKREAKEQTLQRAAVDSGPVSEIPPIVHEVLNSPGQPLERATRAFMEPRFGHDFSSVRVHTNNKATESARAVNALAYTVGQNVVFAKEHYSPQSPDGQRLIAHELAHVVQQQHSGRSIQPFLAMGKISDPSETEADQIADAVTKGERAIPLTQAPSPILRRQTTRSTPQQRGGQAQVATLEGPGGDGSRIRVFRYLCSCAGFDVSRSRTSARLRPRPGVTYEFCRGRTTVRVTGEASPSSFTTGSITVTGDLNVAPASGSAGGRVQVQGEARNTGSEPQVGGRATGRLELPGGTGVSTSGEVMVGTRTGQVDTRVGAGVRIPGGPTVGIEGTNLQDNRRGGQITLGIPLGGPDVQQQTCRECRCPVVYQAYEDIPPRDVEEQVVYNVEDRTPLRYYFRLDTDQDTRDPGLQRESTQTLDRIAQLVASGATVRSIRGFASPEAGEREHNEELSQHRATRLQQLLTTRLGANTTFPEPQASGELLGRVPTITPGSRLADALFEAGFSGPEEVTDFLVGEEISNDQLSNQFLGLLNRITEPADRLRLFGISAESPVAPQLLGATEQFIARRGRGPRPWERIFQFLRIATVEVVQTRPETRTETRREPGSFRRLGQVLANRFGQQAEQERLFGPAEREPSESNCPRGEPANLPDYTADCDYER